MNFISKVCEKLSQIGIDESLSTYKKKRLLVFNRLNLFGMVMSVCWFIVTTSMQNHDAVFIILNSLPFLISAATIFMTYTKKYKLAIYVNTFLIPLALCLASIKVQETSVLLYLLIYTVFPFFYHSKFFKIVVHYLYIVILYAISLYFLQGHGLAKQIIFSPLLQGLELCFLFAVLAVVKIQVMSYERLLKMNKEALDLKNAELTQMLILKNQVLAVISHDIIVPLIGLKNIAEDIINENYSGEELQEVFPLMLNEINNTHNLFSNLLGWSKAQQEGRGDVTADLLLNEVVNQVIELVSIQAENKQIVIENNIDEDLMVHANVDNLLVAIRNLLVNAIKFTPSAGNIFLNATVSADFVKLNITDTGVGIDKKAIKKIFGNELFSSAGTSAETGNGLGLRITQELLHQNGGMVFCEISTLGVGSTFVIQLPKGKNIAEKAILTKLKSIA